MRDLVRQEDADFRLEVEDTGDADAGANDAQADQMVLEVALGEIDGVLAAADRREHRDRRERQLLEHARGVEQPYQRRAQLCDRKNMSFITF